GLVRPPAWISLFTPSAKHHNCLGLHAHTAPLRLLKRRLGFQRPPRPFHRNRQAHQPETAETQYKAAGRQAWCTSSKPPADQQQQQQAARRQDQLLEEIAYRHARLLRGGSCNSTLQASAHTPAMKSDCHQGL